MHFNDIVHWTQIHKDHKGGRAGFLCGNSQVFRDAWDNPRFRLWVKTKAAAWLAVTGRKRKISKSPIVLFSVLDDDHPWQTRMDFLDWMLTQCKVYSK